MQSRVLGAAVMALLLACPAAAQDSSSIVINAQDADQHLAKDTLIGAKVYGKEGTIIGDIEDLILSDGNTVVGVIIGTGGFLGLAEKRIGIDLKALQSVDKDGATQITLPLAHEDLVAASAYQRAMPKKSLLERVKEKAQELTDKTKETSQDAYEKAKPTIDNAKEKAKEVYEDAKEKVQDAIGGETKPEETPATAPEPAPAAEAPPAEPAPAAEAPPAEPAAPAPEAAPAAPPAKVEAIPNQQPSWDERQAGQSIQLKTTEPPAESATPAETPPAAEAPAPEAPAPAEAPAAETPAPDTPPADAPAPEAPVETPAPDATEAPAEPPAQP